MFWLIRPGKRACVYRHSFTWTKSRPFVEVTQWTPPSEPVRACTGESQDHKVDTVMARNWGKLAQTNQRMRKQLRGAAERELSRRARAVEIWAALRSLGKQGVAELIDRTCRHAITFAEGLRARGFDILNDVVLNQVLVSFGNDETTARVISAVQAEGTCWCGGTVWKGRKAMRISVSSWATTDSDVERSLDAILTLAAAESNSTA